MILVGGIVRSTGSGMGCPDWPKCFGGWIPPTSIEQLPENYKEVYAANRERKNQKFARYLNFVGLNEIASRINEDKTILLEADFNLAKTWVEYVNRLVGVAIGGFIIVLFWSSRKFRKTTPKLFFYSLITLITVIIQGWFGSIVVSTNLTTWTITVHMLVALLIVGFLVYLFYLSGKSIEAKTPEVSAGIKALLFGSSLFLLIQILLGTEVREGIDVVASTLTDRNQWIERLGLGFLVHRSFSLVVLAINVLFVIKLRKTSYDKASSRNLIILILGTMLTGAAMGYLGVLPALQPLHLLLATVTFGVQLFMIFNVMIGNTDSKELAW
ncbi:MAG: COX15/CtaA family protein [Bacteroidia bacterium]|nr:COX15/CtaA family protein [Bacteroidia bacterium]